MIVEEVNELSKQDRSFVTPDVLVALKESVEEDVGGTQQFKVASSLNVLVGWWVGQCEDHINHLSLYRDYATTMESYVDRLPKLKLRRYVQDDKELTSHYHREMNHHSLMLYVRMLLLKLGLLMHFLLRSIVSVSFHRQKRMLPQQRKLPHLFCFRTLRGLSITNLLLSEASGFFKCLLGSRKKLPLNSTMLTKGA